MKTRILSAVIGIAVALTLLVLGAHFSIVIDISVALIAAFCVYEGLSAKKLEKKWSISIPCIAFTFAFCMIYTMSLYPVAVFLFFLAVFASMIVNHNKLTFDDFSYAVVITILCTLGLWSVVYLFDSNGSYPGLFYVVTALSTPWLADAGAYFGGSLFGRKKLCPNISPKKTVEGAVSGVIIGTLLSLLVGLFFTSFLFQNGERVNYLLLAVYGFLGAIVSIIGDLSFSLIKRSCGIKDFGNLIPGHGGMLDRFDSVIFSAPLLLIFNLYYPIVVK